MNTLASTFDDAIHALPDDWTVATFDLRVAEPAEHLRDLAAGAVGEFASLTGAYRAPGAGLYRFRLGRNVDSGLPLAPQASHALAVLDRARISAGLTLADVETQSPASLAKWTPPEQWRGSARPIEVSRGSWSLRSPAA